MAKEEGKITTIEFTRTRLTKGTAVFTEMRQDDERAHTFYLLKRVYDYLGQPDQIVMSIETD